ncbi:MAG: hypothetical protein H0W74_14220 [Sphingosinicella sp.]|nr:hypothetical protein [Sphingosinicella sp.]MBA3967112.1 hypothetical protein [Nitrospirales bacterium]
MIAAILLLIFSARIHSQEKDEPQLEAAIPYGYIFFEFALIPGPYRILATEQIVSVNGVIVAQSSVSESNTPTIPTDIVNLASTPPDPKGNPSDGNDDSHHYWESRRDIALKTSSSPEMARLVIIQEMNAHYARSIARTDPDTADGILIQDTYKGKPLAHFYSMKGPMKGFVDKDPVKSAVAGKSAFADFLRRQMWKNNVVWIYNSTSGVAVINPDFQGKFLSEMAKPGNPEIKYQAILNSGALNPKDDLWTRFVHGFTGHAALMDEMAARSARLQPAPNPNVSATESPLPKISPSPETIPPDSLRHGVPSQAKHLITEPTSKPATNDSTSLSQGMRILVAFLIVVVLAAGLKIVFSRINHRQ